MKKIFLISFLSLFFYYLNGQTWCGTQVSDAQAALEATMNITPAKANESLAQLNMELAVTVNIIRDGTGSNGIATSEVYSAFDRLNIAFSPVKLKFRICRLNYIDNYQFDTLTSSNLQDLIIQYHSSNTINLYFASEISDSNDSIVTGLAFMPGDLKDAVILDKELVNGKEIIHQFGHFFNLYHTNENRFGNELTGDTNCGKTGDCCCDTPADPGIRGSLNSSCEYTGTVKDAANQFYVPSATNYMSVGNESCRCSFTNDQYKRIIYTVLNLKKNLW